MAKEMPMKHSKESMNASGKELSRIFRSLDNLLIRTPEGVLLKKPTGLLKIPFSILRWSLEFELRRVMFSR